MTDYRDKVLGCLLASAIGDAMGISTETKTTDVIRQENNGFLRTIITPPIDGMGGFAKKGVVTDDFSLAYFHATDIVKNNGVITTEVIEQSVLRWSQYPDYTRYLGPSTFRTVARLRGEAVPQSRHDKVACYNRSSSNGGGMKAGPVGLFNPDNIEEACRQTLTYVMPTHPNVISMAGACAVACGTSAALGENATVYDAIEAGMYGAREGYKLAQGVCRPVAGPNVEKRIAMAVDIGLRYRGDMEKVVYEIADIIGSSLYTCDSVPAAFGCLAGMGPNAFDTVVAAVNLGDDSDTTACMAGYMAGALDGTKNLPMEHLELIDRMNDFDIAALADDIVRLTKGGN